MIWVNPLKGHHGFEPLAGGMQTPLAHVDAFMEGHNLARSRRCPRRSQRPASGATATPSDGS